MEVVHTIGRRKKAIARVYLTDGKGAITVNGRDVKDYFSTATLQYKLEQAQAQLRLAHHASDLNREMPYAYETCVRIRDLRTHTRPAYAYETYIHKTTRDPCY